MNVVFCRWSQSALNLRQQSIAKYRERHRHPGRGRAVVPEICTYYMYSNLRYTAKLYKVR